MLLQYFLSKTYYVNLGLWKTVAATSMSAGLNLKINAQLKYPYSFYLYVYSFFSMTLSSYFYFPSCRVIPLLGYTIYYY